MINRHVLFDRCMLWVFRTFGRPFFDLSVDSPDFETHLDAVWFNGPPLAGEGLYEFAVDSLGEDVDMQVRVLHYADRTAPLIIYNMGGGEAPFDSTIRRAFPDPLPINVVAVEAPYQRDKHQQQKAFAHLSNYIAMLAMTVKMNEQLLGSELFADAAVTMIAGTSLGGFVATATI